MTNEGRSRFPVRLVGSLAAMSIAAVSIAGALLIAPGLAVAAGAGMPSAGGGTSAQSPPAQQRSQVKKKSPGNRSSIDDFIAGYKAAYAMIYEQGDYEKAIIALRALDRDDDADVANLIGYASRKLGRYDDAKIWYERSLADRKSHV